MKTIGLVLITALYGGGVVHGQDLLLTFRGPGTDTSVDSVSVENLNSGENLTVRGSQVLRLSKIFTGTEKVTIDKDDKITFSPNPMDDYSVLGFSLPQSGVTGISIIDQAGKELLKINENLSRGHHQYRISGFKSGIYFVAVKSGKYSLNGTLVSISSGGNIRAEYISMVSANPAEKDTGATGLDEGVKRSSRDEVIMYYSDGDRLKFIAASGKYRTVLVDAPDSSMTIKFDFLECVDGDGNDYPVVKIGEYFWMAENLKTTTYTDGTPIPFRIYNPDSPDSVIFGWEGYGWYNNNPDYKDTYGALYRFSTFLSGKVCPVGWHAPGEIEWASLVSYLGGSSEAGGRLKETGTAHWAAPNTGATNESGFTAVPGGSLDHHTFDGLRKWASFWSTTKCGGSSDCHWSVSFDSKSITWSDMNEEVGHSIRCVYGAVPKVPIVRTTPDFAVTVFDDDKIFAEKAYAEFSVYNDNGLPVIQSGLCWSTGSLPTLNDPHTADGSDLMTGLAPGTKYWVRAYATNSAGTGYGMSVPFITKMIDVEGNLYPVIQFGEQFWLRKNLKTTKLNDGTSIPQVTNQTEWSNTLNPAFCIPPGLYSNEEDYYGLFYNWHCVNTGKLCPSGWHVPSDEEWVEMKDYFIANGYNYDSSLSGNKIGISMSYYHTFESSSVAGAVGNISWPYLNTLSSHFDGNGVGLRDNAGFSNSWKGGYWWSSSSGFVDKATLYYLFYDQVGLNRADYDKNYGLSVRCIKDQK